jgi:type IV secretory pathway VirD2 relaxase
MTNRDDDSFRTKLAPPRSKKSASPRFIARVIKAVSQAGPVARGRVTPGPKRSGAKLGRGHVAARLAHHRVSATSRRVTIKMRMVVLARTGRRSTSTHLRYLQRDGVTADGERGHAYGQTHDEVDLKDFEHRGQGDRHQFRFIVSAEDGVELQELKPFTRDLMAQMQRDLGTRLEWIAVDHWDTTHPHTHIVLRGKAQDGHDLIIAREYITHGMRARAGEIATEWLGPRTQREIEASVAREVTQERWTGLDVTIWQEAGDGVIDIKALAGNPRLAHQRAAIVGRLNYLSRLGLAEKSDPGVWRVSAKAPEVLRAMGERGDIVRTLLRAMGNRLQEYEVFDSARARPVTGRMVAKGLHDELTDRGYVIVDGLDGRAHYAAVSIDVDFASLPKGAIVEIRAADTRSADRAIATIAQSGIYRSDDHRRQLRADANPARDPEAVVQAHVRRLEALRRAGVVERLRDGTWKVPEDLPERGRAYDLKRLGGATLEMRCHLPIERQTRAIGATWLDQQLVKGSSQLPNTDFGVEVRRALKERADFLIDQGLARRLDARLVLAQNLLATLRNREIAETTARIEATTHLLPRPPIDGIRVSGIYRESIQLTSGRYAMLDDGVGFSLVPWRPVIEKRLGQHISAVMDGGRVSWEFGRSRSLSL